MKNRVDHWRHRVIENLAELQQGPMASITNSRFLFTSNSTLLLYYIVVVVIIQSTGAARELESSPSSASAVLNYWREKLPGTAMPAMVRNLVTPLTVTDAPMLMAEMKQVGSISLEACNTAKIFCDWKNFKGVVDATIFFVGYKCYEGEATCTAEAKTPNRGNSAETITHRSFFRERGLLKGSKITLSDHHDKVPAPAFLPRGITEMVPFGVPALPGLLQKFGIPSDSLLAAAMKRTLTECNRPSIQGEFVSCATSLESMADFVAWSLGSKKVEILVFPGREQVAKEPLIVLDAGVKADSGDKYVSCHNSMFTFGVYYCHDIGNSRVYEVILQAGVDGSIRKGVAVCHMDTSHWSPDHIAFRELGTKPGESEACHWIGDRDLIFV